MHTGILVLRAVVLRDTSTTDKEIKTAFTLGVSLMRYVI